MKIIKKLLGLDHEKLVDQANSVPENPDIEDAAREAVETKEIIEEMTSEESMNELEKQMRDLGKVQKSNLEKAKKILLRTQGELIKLGFSLNAQQPRPEVGLRPLSLPEWEQVEKQKFRDSFIPKGSR